MSTFWTVSSLSTAALIGALLATGLTAGLLFAFAHTVMPGLRTLGDVEFLRAFQRIDAAISNPWMGLAFAGSPLLTLAALVLHLSQGGPVVLWLGVALALIVATIGITGAVNLPRNVRIQSAAPAFAGAAALREHFEGPWVRWNVVRTLTSIGSGLCLCLALLVTPAG